MRGKDLRLLLSWALIGITPAYAGKSPRARCISCNSEDHPRVCGEKTVHLCAFQTSPGSPPRMRGKACPPRPGGRGRRITPAYAGKRPPAVAFLGPHRDHPRVCGEKTSGCCFLGPSSGSPPRMRGKAQAEQVRRFLNGITPAYAGKSVSRLLRKASLWDHPRVCGEKCCRRGS